jgi:hydrogenase maturation factor
MCLIQTGVVVARCGDAAIVEADGRERLVTSLLVPDLEVGEVVLVGLGTVFSRATAEEAEELERMAAIARGPARPIEPAERGT